MFGQLLKALQGKVSDYNNKKPFVLGNLISGNTWNQGIPNFGGVAPKNQSIENPNIISPIPRSDELTKGLIYKMNVDRRGEEQAKIPSTFTPKTVQYPESLANAPKKVVNKPNLVVNKIVKQPLPVVNKPIMQKQVLPAQTTSNPIRKEGYNPQWDFLEKNIFPLTDKAGLPRALVASQWASESGRSTSSPINNYFGLGPHIKYPNLERNVSDYVLTISNILKRKGSDLSRSKDAKSILKVLQSGKTGRYEAHNPDPMTYVNDLMNTPEFRYYNQ